MEALQYKLEKFEGPLDLLLSLIAKNKVNIEDIPISLICEQYIDYLKAAQAMDMEIASEFIVMASELMLIKSRTMLPKPEDNQEDPRKQLTDALIRYQQAKTAAVKLAEQYVIFSGRMVKDTDEISVDKTYVADQDVSKLPDYIRRIKVYMEAIDEAKSHAFTPMISKKVVSVELKIAGIIQELKKNGTSTVAELIRDETSLPDLIAAFVGILELIKVRRVLIDESDGSYAIDEIHGINTRLILNVEENIDAEENEKVIEDY